jgi:hypothetical protein
VGLCQGVPLGNRARSRPDAQQAGSNLGELLILLDEKEWVPQWFVDRVAGLRGWSVGLKRDFHAPTATAAS